MPNNLAHTTMHNDDDINFDDIPKVTNFSGWRKNPLAGTFNGVYDIIVEHDGYNEIVRLDYNKTPPVRETLKIIPKQSASDLVAGTEGMDSRIDSLAEPMTG